MCSAGRVPCAGTRTLVTRSAARRQNSRWRSINLCSFWQSVQSAHIYQRCAGLCVCAAHLSICVDSVAPRALARGALGKEGSRELPGHYTLLSLPPQPIFSCHHSIQTYHFVIPSARSNAPNDTTELLDFFKKYQEEGKTPNARKGYYFVFLLFFAGQLWLMTK